MLKEIEVDVCILGSGFVGPILNRLLLDKGFSTYVVEKDTSSYGHCRSLIKNDFTFDIGGPHIIFSQNRELMPTFEKALGNNAIYRNREVKIRLHDLQKDITFPFESGISELAPDHRLAYLTSLFKARSSDFGNITTIDKWFLKSFGEWAFENYFKPYNSKIWKRPLEKIDINWMRGRVPSPPIESLIRSGLGFRVVGNPAQARFLYPKRGGIQSFAAALGSTENTEYNTYCNSIKKDKGKYVLILNNGSSIRAKRVVSTIPLEDLGRVFVRTPTSIMDLIEALDYNGIITYMFGWIDKKRYPLAFYNPDPSDKFHRITFTRRLSSSTAPSGAHGVVIEQTFPKDHYGRIQTSIDTAECWEFFKKFIGLSRSAEPLVSSVHVSKVAYVVNSQLNQVNRNKVLSFFESQGFFLAGRLGRFDYINMDQAYEQGHQIFLEIRKSFL